MKSAVVFFMKNDAVRRLSYENMYILIYIKAVNMSGNVLFSNLIYNFYTDIPHKLIFKSNYPII